MYLHSSCFSSLGVFVANLLYFIGSFSSWARPQICAIRFLRMVRAWGAPQVRVHAMRRLHAARNAISTAMRRYFSLGRVVKCADAALCDARRLEFAFISSSREPLFGFWSCCERDFFCAHGPVSTSYCWNDTGMSSRDAAQRSISQSWSAGQV